MVVDFVGQQPDQPQPRKDEPPPPEATKAVETSSIFIGSLPPTFTQQTLTELLVQMGPVKDVRIPKDASGGARGIAFCDYYSPSSALYAIAVLDDISVSGHRLRVRECAEKGQEPSPVIEKLKSLAAQGPTDMQPRRSSGPMREAANPYSERGYDRERERDRDRDYRERERDYRDRDHRDRDHRDRDRDHRDRDHRDRGRDYRDRYSSHTERYEGEASRDYDRDLDRGRTRGFREIVREEEPRESCDYGRYDQHLDRWEPAREHGSYSRSGYRR